MRDLLKNSSIRALVLSLKSIPSPPALYHELQTELQSEDVSLKKIADIVTKDAGMTAKILQLANSAFMGARFNVSNPTQAITLIGTESSAPWFFPYMFFPSSKILPLPIAEFCGNTASRSRASPSALRSRKVRQECRR